MISVVAFPDRYTPGDLKADASETKKARAGFASVAELLTARLSSDVHFAAYSADRARRHTIDLWRPEHASESTLANVRMVLAIFDIDGPAHVAASEWRAEETPKIAALLATLPDGVVYQTAGGYRIVYALPEPFPLRSQADDETWTARYLSWCRYLERAFGIAADTRCADWTHLFRAPFVVRDGVRQELPLIGEPKALGLWAPKLTKRDLARARPTTEVFGGAVVPVPIPDMTSAYAEARIAPAVDYLERCALSIEGQGGRVTFFAVACVLMRRHRLPLDVAADLVEQIYNPRLLAVGTTTWDRDEIEDRLASAASTASRVPAGDVPDERTWTDLVHDVPAFRGAA